MSFRNLEHYIAKDKALKVILTALCFTSFVLGVWFPILSLHNNVLVFTTNMLWLWEA